MDRNINVTPVKELEAFEALRMEWDQLLLQIPRRQIFQTWEWQFAWWKHLGRLRNELYILAIRDGATLIGLLPLMRNLKRKKFFTLQRLEALGAPDCDVNALITIEPLVCVDAVLCYLKEHSAEWDLLEIMDMDVSHEATDQLISKFRQADYGSYIGGDPHYYIPIQGSWEVYFKSLTHNHKHNMKRRLRRAKEEGDLGIKRFRGESLTRKHFEIIFGLNEKGSFPRLYKTEHDRNFHLELHELTKDRNWLQIEVLCLENNPIAFQYGFTYEDRYMDWRGGFDKAYGQLGPGNLLLFLSMQDRFIDGCTEVDFLRGNQDYKQDWKPLSREFVGLKVYNTRKAKPIVAYLLSKIRQGVRRQ